VGTSKRASEKVSPPAGQGKPTAPVIVIDPFPIVRRGLAGALGEAGFEVHEAPDIRDRSLVGVTSGVVVVTVRSSEDLEVAQVLIHSHPGISVVLVLPEPSPQSYTRALQAGACAAVSSNASADEIADCVREAASDRTVLPRVIALALAEGRGLAPESILVTPEEIDWIRTLARSVTVEALAREASLSERDMYRHLNDLYQRMGVGNRNEALVQAGRWGWTT